ncbi:CMRF35-like molecule 1 isoform X2 [Megalobrama amblycephala]|uniref:CMRF35-like molecule 1 isoform X2 n=1 Tax=Megalobrama amblycephala TaxID=75352 RepID=UPI002013FDB1|nr:CMRF35-like molecule 1 isoform X2 [Megalobrama amblycephala]
MSFCVFGIWICLSGIGISATEIYGYSGKHIIISCSHKWASTNIKYFCRDPCGDILVKSDRSPEGRYRLEDFGTGTFNVTITDLQESDSGIYRCGVERVGIDTYQKVNLKVSKGESWDSQSSTTASSSSTSPSPDDNITNAFSTTGPVVSSKPAVYENTQSGPLIFTAITLSVMVIISAVVLCVWNIHIRKSHSSNDEAEIQGTTCSTEPDGDYEEITKSQRQIDAYTNVTIYSTVNKSLAANQIQDPPLYSTITISPETSCKQTPNSNADSVDSVAYSAISIHAKGCTPSTIIGSEDKVTYDTVHFSKATL